MIILITILLVSAYILTAIYAGKNKATMDTLNFWFESSIFSKKEDQQFWNPALSWRNKYKNFDPKQGEAFKGSTTWRVGETDAWHKYQGRFYSLNTLSMIVQSVLSMIIIYVDFINDFEILMHIFICSVLLLAPVLWWLLCLFSFEVYKEKFKL